MTEFKDKLRCEYCDKVFKHGPSLIRHRRSHTGVCPYVCDWLNCEKKFSQSSTLKRHKLTHTGQKDFECDICGYKCSLKGNLVSHIINVHNKKAKCSSQVPGAQNFADFSGRNPHRCEYENCGKSFSSPSKLEEHVKTHTGVRPHACNWPGCDKKFIQRSNLKAHKRVHTKEKNYECDLCKHRFSRKAYRDRHTSRVHCQKSQEEKIKKVDRLEDTPLRVVFYYRSAQIQMEPLRIVQQQPLASEQNQMEVDEVHIQQPSALWRPWM